MPLDPSISLQAQVPQFAAQNPIQTLGSLAVMQNQLNQARLFQQTFAAKMQMGQMIASSPDLDTAFNNITKSGLVGYAPELALMVKQMHQAEVGIAGEQQKQVGTALEGAQKYTAMAFNNPAMMPQVQKMALDSLPANAPPAARAALNDYFTAITSGVQPGMTPQQATGTFQSNAIGAMTSAGIPAPTQQMVTGETGLAPLGGSLQPYYRAPIGAGGGLTPTGPGLPMTLSPQVTEPGRLIVGGAAGTGGGGGLAAPGASAAPASAAAPVYTGGMSPGQLAYTTDRGKDMAGYQKNLDSTVSSMYGVMQNIQEAQKAMTAFRPGGGADVYARVAQIAQAFGAPQDLVDKIGNGNLASTQEFQKLMVNNVMGQIRQQLPSGSRLAQYEFQQFQRNNPNIDTDPRAIGKIFSFWGNLYNQAHSEQSGLNSFLAAPGADISRWPATWQNEAIKRGYINPGQEGLVGPGAYGSATETKGGTAGTTASAGPAAASSPVPTSADISYLRAHPEAKAQFEKHFGPGSADKVQ